MPVSSSDITLVLSGGINNTDPTQSLGGDASLFTISNNINNLFSDITPSQALSGYVDYRCIYVINSNPTFSFYNISLFLQGQADNGSQISFGVLERDEIQLLTINGSPTGGSLVIKYENALSPTINWNNNPAVFAQNLQNGLNATSGLSQVACSQGTLSNQFLVQFNGNDGNRNQNLLIINNNSLTPSVPIPVFTTVVDGSPKNDIADSIGFPTITPNGVAFVNDSITIGELRPTEGFPLWFQRTTQSGVGALLGDGFSLLIQGTVFP